MSYSYLEMAMMRAKAETTPERMTDLLNDLGVEIRGGKAVYADPMDEFERQFDVLMRRQDG